MVQGRTFFKIETWVDSAPLVVEVERHNNYEEN